MRKKLEETQIRSKRERMAESLKLPKDSVLGASIVTITGKRDVFVENYKGIIEYTDCRIILQGKNCKIEICGKRLNILYYTNEDMKISGWIENVRYMGNCRKGMGGIGHVAAHPFLEGISADPGMWKCSGALY